MSRDRRDASPGSPEAEWNFKIAKLELQAGDFLVISFPEGTGENIIQRASETMRAMLPKGTKHVVKTDDITLTVVSPDGVQTISKDLKPGVFIRRQHGMSGMHVQQIIVDDPHEK